MFNAIPLTSRTPGNRSRARSTKFSEFVDGDRKFSVEDAEELCPRELDWTGHPSLDCISPPADSFIVLRRGNNISALETNCALLAKDTCAIKMFKDPWHGTFTFHKQSSRVARAASFEHRQQDIISLRDTRVALLR